MVGAHTSREPRREADDAVVRASAHHAIMSCLHGCTPSRS